MAKEFRNSKGKWNSSNCRLACLDFGIRASFVIRHSSFGFSARPPPSKMKFEETLARQRPPPSKQRRSQRTTRLFFPTAGLGFWQRAGRVGGRDGHWWRGLSKEVIENGQ